MTATGIPSAMQRDAPPCNRRRAIGLKQILLAHADSPASGYNRTTRYHLKNEITTGRQKVRTALHAVRNGREQLDRRFKRPFHRVSPPHDQRPAARGQAAP